MWILLSMGRLIKLFPRCFEDAGVLLCFCSLYTGQNQSFACAAINVVCIIVYTIYFELTLSVEVMHPVNSSEKVEVLSLPAAID